LEIALWGFSVIAISLSSFFIGRCDWLALITSVLGATSLLLNAKGNVWGQILTVVFSIIYGIISYRTAYYGEMITYLGMTAPIAIASVFTWLRNPVEEGKNEVKVNHLSTREYVLLFILTSVITVIFYYILDVFNTAVLWLSTLSVFTSFMAAYLTMRRSKFFALAYASNDVVLIGLWIIASCQNIGNISMVICFSVFLINDLYGFYNWSNRDSI
jgi:nicotinamide mononucleotide transporter PnuC